jgi:hypothetical protein
MLSLTMLPARQGDALWIRWGDPDQPQQLLIDMGTEEVGTQLRERLLALPPSARRFELMVVTHVDRDHIGGVLTCLAEADPIPGLVLGDVWFNGYPHLMGGSVRTILEPMGPAQGERLAVWLRQHSWNSAFNGGPVKREPGQDPTAVDLAGGLRLTVLGPTPERLRELEPVWKDEVAEALRKGTLTTVSPGLEPMGSKAPPELETAEDLAELAERRTAQDNSEANGSSIALLLQYGGRSVLLAGDAFADDLVSGIQAVAGDGRLALDAFKLPHHCSQSNVTKDLVDAVDCSLWLVSTDGAQFRHPDPTALARIIRHSASRPPRLAFNVPSTFNRWWANDAWCRRYHYETQHGTKRDGLTLGLAKDAD